MCTPHPHRFVVGHAVLRPKTTVKLEVPVDEERYSRITRKVYLAAEIAETWPLLAPLCLWYVEGWTRRLEDEEVARPSYRAEAKAKSNPFHVPLSLLNGVVWQGHPFLYWDAERGMAVFGGAGYKVSVTPQMLVSAGFL